MKVIKNILVNQIGYINADKENRIELIFNFEEEPVGWATFKEKQYNPKYIVSMELCEESELPEPNPF